MTLPILVFPQPFVEAAEERIPDVFELSVFEVEPKFLKGAAYLDPWVSPGVGFVEPFFVIHIFYHIFGMTERKLRFMSPHGEDTAVSFWCGLDASSEVRAVGREA